MSLTSGSIPNFVNGVSRQSPSLRLPSQAQEQINGLSTLAGGLKKRGPTRHLARLYAIAPDSAFSHVIDRDEVERYVVVIADGDLKVFDLSGNEKTVAFPDGKGYLTTIAAAADVFFALTVADHTFVVNSETEVAMSASLTATRDREALVHVKQGQYGRDYRIRINGSSAGDYTTPNGSDPLTEADDLDTSSIANELRSDLASNGYDTSPWDTTRYGHVLHVSRNDGTDFVIDAEDGQNGHGMVAVKSKLNDFADLPNDGPDGFVVEIVGDPSQDFDNYWVKFVKNDAGSGIWQETVQPGIKYALDAATMPHLLVREGDGTFTFKRATWGERTVGDETSAPEPSFVGRAITDVFFHRNRLGLLSGENVIMSEASEFFNFWPTTAAAIVDSDPIDVNVSHIRVSLVKHAVPYRDLLVLFSPSTQFSMTAADLLTQRTVSITPTTELPNSPAVPPVATGESIFFASEDGWARFYEYMMDLDAGAFRSEEITSHVPGYIPTGLRHVAATPKFNIMVSSTDEHPNRLYVHQWYWANRQKLQAAWHYWDFGDDAAVVGFDFIGPDLLLVIKRGTEIYLEAMTVDPVAADEGIDHLIYLDRRIHSSALAAPSYDGVADQTTYTLPFAAPAGITAVAAESVEDEIGAGVEIDAEAVGSTVVVEGDTTGLDLFFGVPFEFYYRLSEIVLQEETRSGAKPVAVARLQLRRMVLIVENTSGTTVKVTPKGRQTYQYQINGYALGTTPSTLDDAPLYNGKFPFPILAQSNQVTIEFVSEGHLPCGFISADWEGMVHMRSPRG